MRGFPEIGLLAVLAMVSGHAAAQEPIPLVHTWGDLQGVSKLTVTPSPIADPQKTAPTPVSGPATFQVGISNDKATVGGAVLLYFLGSTGSKHPYTPEEWGVYWLQIDGMAQVANSYWITYHNEDVPTGTLFYAEAISFLTPGDHVVELIKPFAVGVKPEATHEVLARATVHVQDASDSLWYPLWTTRDTSQGAASGENADNSRYAIETVKNPKGDAAIPSPPRPNWYTNFPSPDKALPTLFPAETADSQVQLKLADSTLIVTFDSKIEGFFPDDYFLTRWWVNGKQVELDPKAQRPGQLRGLGMQDSGSIFKRVAWQPNKEMPMLNVGTIVWYTQEIHFELNFQPDWIGAKKGDRVGVQFLYCPDHFIFTGKDQMKQFGEHYQPDSVFSWASFSEISNRIEFTYSGDPKHPSQ